MPHSLTSTIHLSELVEDMKHSAIAAFAQWPDQKAVIAVLAAGFFGVFPHATHEILLVLLGAFCLDFAFGVAAALMSGEGLDRRKGFQSVGKFAFYLFFSIMVFKAVRIVPVLGTQDTAIAAMAVVSGVFIAQDLHSVLVNVQRAGFAKTGRAKKVLKKVLEGSD